MNPVEQFLQHGTLPFVGRSEEIERILEFRRGIVESQRLRALLLTAEAGAGKSRLLGECVGRIEAEGGVVVHAKFYPEAANDLAGLLAGALWNSAEGRKLLGMRPNDTIAEVIAALRRISRLRPTLLALEDLHLLTAEAIPDLAVLLGGLSDETLSLLALARPVQLQARGLLENYLTEIIEMKGLERSDIAELWQSLFGAPAKGEEIVLLRKTTFGNGLALRSALRALLQTSSVKSRGTAGPWRLTISVPEFESILRQSVSLVVEGLVVGLTPEMREDLSRIAWLGEVFARETAERVVGSDDRLAGLLETDLLIETAHPVPPIPGCPVSRVEVSWPASRYPLIAFTHSLLHNYLVDRGMPDAGILCRVLAEELPLYSLLPFRLLRGLPVPAELEGQVLLRSLIRGFAVAQMIDRTSNWKESYENVWLTVEYLLPLLEGRVPEEEYRIRNIMVKTVKLSLLRREINSPRWDAALEEAMEASEQVLNAEEARGKLLAYSQWFEWRSRLDYPDSLSIRQRVIPLLEEYPALRHDIAYVYYIDGLASAADRVGDVEMLRTVEGMIRELTNDPTLPEQVRTMVVGRLLKYSLQTFSSVEEIEERNRLIELIEEENDEEDPYYGVTKTSFLEITGRFEEGADLAERVGKHCRDHGVWLNALLCESSRGICRAGLGEPTGELVARGKMIVAEGEEHELRPVLLESVANNLLHIGLYRGEPDLPTICAAFGMREDQFSPAQRALHGLWNGDRESLRLIPGTRCENYIEVRRDVWERWGEYLESGPEMEDELLLPLLEEPVLRTGDLITISGTVRLRLMHREDGLTAPTEETTMFRNRAVDAIGRALGWLEERRIFPFMVPLIDLLKRLGETGEAERWEGRKGENRIESRSGIAAEGMEGRIRISMLGTIRVALPSEDFAPVRGVRIRTLLGLMVADGIISRPLSADEFVRLAGGDDPDPEHARKKKNMGVVRLREILGREAILTDGETPQLNDELVEVDLLRADRAVREALQSVSEGALIRALPLVEEALEITGGEVPFPTLYDDFFEAVREDFEHRLRRAVMETGGGLLEAGDADRAEELLRKGFEVLPGDEEIGEMLRDALIASGNRVEAERVRMGGG